MLGVILTVALGVAVALFGGTLCVLMAEAREVSRGRAFAFGVAAGAVGSIVGGWGPAGLIGLAALMILAIGPGEPSPTDMPPSRTGIRAGRRRSFWWLQIGCLVVIGVMGYGPLAGGVQALRRTASAPAIIVSTSSETVSGNDLEPRVFGVWISYKFEVDGHVYTGTARRDWRLTDCAKVCYDPADPKGNHSIEESGYSCGGLDRLSADGG